MRNFTLAALAIATLAGCATAPQEPAVSSYSYDSKAHSGTVHVTDKFYTSEAVQCAAKWREGEVYTPKGIIPMGHDHLDISIDLKVEGQPDTAVTLSVPQDLGGRVYTKDLQELKSFMLGTETNGIVQQGDHFTFPEGYFIRVSQPAVKGWNFVSCIGIDHMYVLKADLESSTNPPVYLDRVVVPFSMEQADQPVKVSFGSQVQHTAELRVEPNK